LFTDYPPEAVVACADDPHPPYMTQGVTSPLYLYSADNSPAQWRAVSREIAVKDGRMGMSFTALRQGDPAEHICFLPLPGVYNIQNALAALTVVCERFGVSPECAAESLAKAVVNGRFETVTHPALPGVTFIIDYAHNGVSLASVLDAIADYSPRRIICLFGSVGGRTKERRRDLAEAAANRCDLCILTSDNPGCEPPMDVIEEIDAAFPAESCPRVKIPDRAEAIRYAVEIAAEGDVILLAGKGHENYQLVGVKRIPFSETEILLRAIEERAGMPVS
jgi:UDP-N-acetylmuramoyl-L-alanyl-D-glutamate--2,6-diaminopimelate ligase